MTLAWHWLIVPAFIVLTACDVQQATANLVASDCLDLPVYPPPGVVDLKQDVFVCVERNAALYAKGSDSPEQLSSAVAAKCQPTIMRYVEQRARESGEQPQYTEALEAWRQHALPVIAEARARGCYS